MPLWAQGRFTFDTLSACRPAHLALLLLALFACQEQSSSKPTDPKPRPDPGALPDQKAQEGRDQRFIQIRDLLRKKPDAKARATQLFPLVKPLCEDAQARAAFMDTAAWSASMSVGSDVKLTQIMASDTIEHVVTTCFRLSADAAFDLLARAIEKMPKEYRFHLMRARFLAVQDKLPEALEAAKAAQKLGSNHGLALLANLQAQIARGEKAGYRTGMFDEAIKTVSMEPDGKWHLVDVAAILMTRAHLLTERAIWEGPQKSERTILRSHGDYQRLSKDPFPPPTRRRAQDVHCFDVVELNGDRAPCALAAKDSKHLGAAVVSKFEMDNTFDQDRLGKLKTMAESLRTMPKGAAVLLSARGDETELIEWARPTALLLRALAKHEPKLIVVDRTRSPRSGAMLDRIVERSGVKPALRLNAKKGTSAMPCVASVLAERQAPKSCPFDEKIVAQLEKMAPLHTAFLVGRDLDAEIDDLHLYKHRTALLSFRTSRMKKGISAWLKSVTDVLILAPPSEP